MKPCSVPCKHLHARSGNRLNPQPVVSLRTGRPYFAWGGSGRVIRVDYGADFPAGRARCALSLRLSHRLVYFGGAPQIRLCPATTVNTITTPNGDGLLAAKRTAPDRASLSGRNSRAGRAEVEFGVRLGRPPPARGRRLPVRHATPQLVQRHGDLHANGVSCYTAVG